MRTRTRRPHAVVCPPWQPSTNDLAWRGWLLGTNTGHAQLVENLDADAQLANDMLSVVSYAWPHLSNELRARVLVLVVTDDVRAIVTTRARELELDR